ncbi:HNH endonuclease signature motif containing protein [Nocardioides sp. InS609-2]|uniref:HNH endonuclease signature motif containing protein n=1 Tax=Nocardioides sp. InS609-2 TaxID=2760705 RepID=UPI0020C0FA3D|nr:HNH endonuclease signature motif containing protein [Nocardioides sp. InS609-2]
MTHPVLECADVIDSALKDVAGVSVPFMDTPTKREALLRLTALTGQLEALRLRVIAAADDVADHDGARDVASWLAKHARVDRPAAARSARLADALDQRWPVLAQGLAEGDVNVEQAAVIARALDHLPADIPAETRAAAEARLVADAGTFAPHQLRVLGRRILDIVAPELGEAHERRALEAEEHAAHRQTSLTTHRRGDGSTDIRIRVPDATADRLLTYLHAFTTPRRHHHESTGQRLPHDQALGHAFRALLETLDPHRLPLHGGDATTVIVTIDIDTLRDGLGIATTDTGTPITAAEARRLACTAHLIPAVLGGTSEPLDLGRGTRLFSRHQRKAFALRDHTCRADGCDIPAAWTEAHHQHPWSHGGPTNLDNGLLLCSWHHHRAHDDRYLHDRLPNGDLRFHRRR